jgi:predicted peptidase
MRHSLTIATLLLAVTGCAQTVSGPTSGSVTDYSRASQHAEPSELARWQSRFEARSFRSQSGIILPYRIATPSPSSPRPLVLVLHGSGAIGSDNRRQLGPFAAAWVQLQDDPRSAPIILVPQVSERSAEYMLCDGLPCASRPGRSLEALLQLMDSFATSDAVDRRRIYVVGFSMGGSAALQLALARPQLIAGMVVFAPVPPPKDRASELARLPLLVVHGSSDTENPFNAMRDWMDHLKASGGTAKFSVRKGMQHQVPDDMLVSKAWRRRLLRNRLEARR